MIEFFTSIQDALNYAPYCLLCRHSMRGLDSLVPGAISSLKIDYDNRGYGDYHSVITYTLIENGYKDNFTINVVNNSITRQTDIEMEDQVVSTRVGLQTFKSSAPSLPVSSGYQYLSLGVACKSCHKYDYTLQLVICVKPLVMARIALNSERLVFQEGEWSERRELRNVYTTKRTTYSYFPEPKLGAVRNELKQELPLIPFNREDPNKTLERVKNLLIFT